MTISFHLPPSAASAAVSGQPVTGFFRTPGTQLPAGAFLSVIGRIGYNTVMSTPMAGVLCAMALIAPAFAPTPPSVLSPGWSAQATTPQRDGRRDFDFEFGTWRTRLSRLLHPLTGSTTWVHYEGTSVVRKVWDG